MISSQSSQAQACRSARFLYPALLGALVSWCFPLSVQAVDKVTYTADVLPVLRNNCLNCHNADKRKAGLDLSSYQGVMQGSDSNKVIEPGNPGNSLMLKLIMHTDEPAMPPKSDKIPDSQIDVIRKWIEGYALENAGSKAAVAKNAAPALEMFADDKQDGPPPMPHDLLLEPALKTSRPGSVVSLAASPRAPLIAIAAQKQVLLYDTGTLELAGVLPFPEGFPAIVKFSRDGRLVIAGGGVGAKSGRVVVWDISTGKRVLEAGDEFDAVLAADISPDHHYIALGGPARMVKIFKDGKLAFSIKKHTDWITALAFTSDGKMLISGDRQGGLAVWEVATGGEMFTLPSHKAGVTAIAAPGPQACLSASEDGTLKFWDLREGKEIKSINGNKGGTLSAAFAPDGRLVACGRDKHASVWDRDGNKVRDFDKFDDVALSAVISQDKIIASDWTGAIRVWNMDGKRLAELSPAPPTVAERLSTIETRLPDLQARREKIAASLASVEADAAKSSADAKVAAQAAGEAEKLMRDDEARIALLQKSFDDASGVLKKAQADYAQLQTSSQSATDDLAKAIAANDTAERDEKNLEGGMQERQTRADKLAEAAKTAQALADKQPGDQSLADAATSAKADADKAQEEVSNSRKSATAAETEIARMKDVVAKAKDAAASAKDAMEAAHRKADEQTAAAGKSGTELAAAKDSYAKSKANFDEVAKNLPPKAELAEAATQKLSKAKQELASIDHDLGVAKGDRAKWKAAEINITLYAARKELADRQADHDKVAADAKDVSADLDKAQSDLDAATKHLADAPARIKTGEEAIAQAHAAMDKANAEAAAARDTVTHKETLIAPASDFAAKLATESSQSSNDAPLKDAAAKAKETLDLLNRDLADARHILEGRDAASKQAATNVTNAEQALAREKADIEAAPAAIVKLTTTRDETAKRTADARAAAEKKVAEAAKPVAEAQSKVDAIAHDYEALCKESQSDYASVAELTKK